MDSRDAKCSWVTVNVASAVATLIVHNKCWVAIKRRYSDFSKKLLQILKIVLNIKQ